VERALLPAAFDLAFDFLFSAAKLMGKQKAGSLGFSQ
jgi:hypothetical protein